MCKYLSFIDKEQPSYLIITAALFKAEVYWVCSAISCLYHSTTLGRSIAAHPTSSYDSSKITEQIIITAADDRSNSEDDATQLSEMEQRTAHRRLSLPLLVVEDDDSSYNAIRYRPSAADEMTGTTCPPVWWQKAKIKMSHSRSNSLQKSITAHSSLDAITTMPIPEEQNVDETCQPMLDYPQSIHSRHSSTPSAISQHSISSSFEKKHHHRAKKMMTKIKTRIIKISRHRRGTSLDLDELKL